MASRNADNGWAILAAIFGGLWLIEREQRMTRECALSLSSQRIAQLEAQMSRLRAQDRCDQELIVELRRELAQRDQIIRQLCSGSG